MSKPRSKGTGSVDKLPNGRYRARIKIDYSASSKCFNTLREANAWLAEVQTGGTIAQPSKQRLTDWWDTWVEAYKLRTVTVATLNSYASSKHRLSAKILNSPISSVTTAQVQSELNRLSDSGLKRRTVEMTRTALNMCLGRAVIDKLIMTNPVTITTLPKQDAEKGRPLTIEEEFQLVEICYRPSKYDSINVIRHCLLFILRTGCRSSEGTGIRWDDIENDRIHIRGTKTAGSNRWLPLTTELIHIIDAMRPERSPYVFATSTGTRIQKDNLVRHMRALTGHTVKDLRHTFATRAAQAGVNPKTLMTLLGHTSVETTLMYYTHINTDDQLLAMQSIASKCHESATTPKITNIS